MRRYSRRFNDETLRGCETKMKNRKKNMNKNKLLKRIENIKKVYPELEKALIGRDLIHFGLFKIEIGKIEARLAGASTEAQFKSVEEEVSEEEKNLFYFRQKGELEGPIEIS